MSSPEPLLAMRHINKAFSGVPALVDAHLDVGHHEVRALIGENGAGKSTMIKVLTGVYRRDSGEITFDGRPASFASPSQAQRGGIGKILQGIF